MNFRSSSSLQIEVGVRINDVNQSPDRRPQPRQTWPVAPQGHNVPICARRWVHVGIGGTLLGEVIDACRVWRPLRFPEAKIDGKFGFGLKISGCW